MYTQNTALMGTLYIVFGVLLFLCVAGTWLFRLGLTMVAYHIINYGLALKGLPPLTFYVSRWLSGTRPF